MRIGVPQESNSGETRVDVMQSPIDSGLSQADIA
jgi:hypothetical protein